MKQMYSSRLSVPSRSTALSVLICWMLSLSFAAYAQPRNNYSGLQENANTYIPTVNATGTVSIGTNSFVRMLVTNGGKYHWDICGAAYDTYLEGFASGSVSAGTTNGWQWYEDDGCTTGSSLCSTTSTACVTPGGTTADWTCPLAGTTLVQNNLYSAQNAWGNQSSATLNYTCTPGASVVADGTAGSNQWNCLVYNSQTLGTNYSGYYPINALNFDSRLSQTYSNNSWNQSTQGPSYSAGYLGCHAGVDNISYRFKRTGFPCGVYTIQGVYDDNWQLYKNGTLLNSGGCCTGTFTNLATSVCLGPNTTLDFTIVEGGGDTYGGLFFGTPATLAITSGTTVCSGGTIALTANATGGTYSVTANGTYGSISGSNFIAGTNNTGTNQTVTIQYSNEGCTATQNITVYSATTAPTGISGTTLICAGGSTTLTATGGVLGTGANYVWGTGTVGSGVFQTSTSVTATVTPASTTNYWVSVTGTSAPCSNPSGSATTTVTVNTKSTAPTSASPAAATICNGGSTTLSYTGGSLGTGASAKWYSGSCGGTLVGTGNGITVSPTSTTTYFVRFEDPAPCSTNTACVSTTVNVNTASTAPTGISGTTLVCNGTGTTLTATGGSLGTGATYQWGTGGTVGTNPIGGATSVSYTVTPSSTTTYWVSVTGAAPCGSPAGGATTTVTVNTASTAPTGISGTTLVCNGTGTTLTATGGALGTGATYQWGTGSTVGTNPIGGATAATYSVTPASTTTYWVSVTGAAPCGSPAGGATATVTVNTPSTAPTGISGTTLVCNGTGTTLTATGGSLGTGATYQWGTGSTVGTNPIGGATSVSYTVTPSSTTTYWVSVTGAAPCGSPAGGATKVVTVNTASTAPTSISGTTLVCNGTGTTLTATGGSLGTGATYQWGTGSTVGTNPIGGATAATYSVTPASTTTYWVSVTGAAPCGSPAGGATATVTVNTPSTAPTGISGTTTLCGGTGTTLTATGGSLGTGATYQWGTGAVPGTNPIGGATSVSYTVTPASTTTYWVSVTGAAPCGSPAGNASTTVTVNNGSVAPTSISGTTTICNGSSTTLTAVGGTLGTGAQYVWGTGAVGTGVFQTSASITASVTPSSTTSYWVSVTGTAAPCSNPGGSATTTVTVNNPSTAPTSIGGFSSICQGASITLSASGGTLGTGAQYVWGTGAVGTGVFQTSTSTTATVTPSSTTSYWVSVTGTTAPCANPGGSATKTITVAIPSTAVTGISGITSICSGNGTTLTATGGSLGTGANYQWGTGNVIGSNTIPGATSVSYSVTPASTTDYWVSVTGPSPCNGANGVSTTVTVTTTPTPTFTAAPSGTVCASTSVTYTTQSGYSSYVWSGFGTAGVDYTIVSGGLSATDYTVTLQWLTTGTKAVQVSYSNGSCPAVTPASSSITVAARPTPGLTVSGTTCIGSSLTYSTQTGQSSYVWTLPGATAGVDYTLVSGGSSTDDNIVVQWIVSGSHTVTVNYNNAAGCTALTAATDTRTVNAAPSSASIADVIDPCNGGHTATVTITGGTSPYNFSLCGTGYTNQSSPFVIPAGANSSCSLTSVTDANGCPAQNITGSPVSYPTPVLTSGDTYACVVSTAASKVFYDHSGNLMVKITDGGNTLGNTTVVTTVDGSVQQFGPTTPQSYLQRHFRISPSNTSGSANVCLYISDAEVAALNTASASDNSGPPSFYATFQATLSNAVVTKFHGGAETPQNNTSRIVLTRSSAPTHNPTVNGVTYNNVWEFCMNVSSWSGFYMHAQNVNNTPLPVTLLYLTADAIDNKYINLDWATASEINNNGFAIERSTNGSDFTQIAWVAGHGNSNTQLTYAYSDRTVQPGVVYYYRLKQVDYDGASTLSDIVSASLIGDKGFSFEDMIPNPAINSVQLGIITTAGQKASVTMTDMLGRVVLSQPWQLSEGYNISSFDISGLAQGTYSVTVQTGNNATTKKLVVTR